MNVELNGQIHGIKVVRGYPIVSYIFLFVDDTILFTRDDIYEANFSKIILDNCCVWSSKEINLHKSSLSFSQNISVELRSNLRNFLQGSLIRA